MPLSLPLLITSPHTEYTFHLLRAPISNWCLHLITLNAHTGLSGIQVIYLIHSPRGNISYGKLLFNNGFLHVFLIMLIETFSYMVLLVLVENKALHYQCLSPVCYFHSVTSLVIVQFLVECLFTSANPSPSTGRSYILVSQYDLQIAKCTYFEMALFILVHVPAIFVATSTSTGLVC